VKLNLTEVSGLNIIKKNCKIVQANAGLSFIDGGIMAWRNPKYYLPKSSSELFCLKDTSIYIFNKSLMRISFLSNKVR
jgi:hypothetical protein